MSVVLVVVFAVVCLEIVVFMKNNGVMEPGHSRVRPKDDSAESA